MKRIEIKRRMTDRAIARVVITTVAKPMFGASIGV